MKNFKKTSLSLVLVPLVLLAASIFFLLPLYLVLLNSVKSLQEISNSMLTFPHALQFENFTRAAGRMNYFRSFYNSIKTALLSAAGVIFFASMAAYQMVRRPCPVSSILYFSILGSIAIPFQALMVPVVIVAKNLGFVNSTNGLVVLYWGFLLPMAIFLYHGFIKSVPRELEEAAMIDGCGQLRTFFLIVFPLIKPVTATVAIIDILGVFNDFMLPLIMLSSRSVRTIPLAMSVFFTSYLSEWNYIMAALTLSILPMLLFFLFMQKHIIGGLAAGAIKG